MASIECRTRSTRVVAYVNKEKLIFVLGPVNKKAAERFANNIDALLNERRCNLPLSQDVSKWLAGLDQPLYDQLVARDLAEPRIQSSTLDKFISGYITGRTDVGERRTGKLNLAKRRMVDYFGDVNLNNVTPGGADEYARWLLTKLSSATAHKECQIATQFFRHAFRKRLIERNPFDGVTVGRATNDDRRVFVTRKTIKAVLDKCPNWQWRTVLALARYGGLRCSSEVALLKWSDIHWDRDRFTVTSPKTTRYGKASRIVPIFPELRPFLDEAFSMADEGEMWVVPMLAGDIKRNLGTTFQKIVARSGETPWVKPFQNCRSSRQTELEQNYPTYVVCSWLGNTPKVAHTHYLTVTDDHFNSALKTGDSLGMQPPVLPRRTPQAKKRKVHSIKENAGFAEVVGILENALVAEEGFEPPTRGL